MTKPALSPFGDYLDALHARLCGMTGGEVATYIPELAKAPPEGLAISVATTDGTVYSVGDSAAAFSIQSVSKPFAYGDALRQHGAEAVMRKVGVEPTGEAFNAIVLDEAMNRPYNPMVNAGAIAVTALTPGADAAARQAHSLRLFSAFAGRPLTVDEAVYRSEAATGHRNRAIAWLMLNSGMIEGDPEAALDLYFRQCAYSVTTPDLALMGATLANNGTNPRTGETVLSPAEVRDVLTVMMSCGMYDYAGEWSYDVGLPAKSGVSGAVLAILPGQLAIAAWSPPLDPVGNSVRGVAACREISRDFGLHLFLNAATVEDVIRRETTAARAPSLRLRSPRERDRLEETGHRIALIELQGALYFASAERLARRLSALCETAETVILDTRRVTSLDAAALRLLRDTARAAAPGTTLALAATGACPSAIAAALQGLAAETGLPLFDTADAALEHFEDRLLAETPDTSDTTRFPLETIPLFSGLARDQLARVEALLRPMQFEAGDTILHAGAPARLFFVLARGSVSILVPGTPPTRVGGIGPGQTFGEMAALDGGPRSADVIADSRVICYGLSRDDLATLADEDPRIPAAIHAGLAREFAARLRRSNALVAALA